MDGRNRDAATNPTARTVTFADASSAQPQPAPRAVPRSRAVLEQSGASVPPLSPSAVNGAMNTPAAYPAVQGQLPLPEQRWPMPADAPAGLAPAGPSLERKVTVPRDEPIPAGSTLPSRPVQLGAWDNVPTTADMDALPGEGGPAGGVLRVYCTSWNMANNPPPASLKELLTWDGTGTPHTPGDCDVYAIGTQEAGIGHAAWDRLLRDALGVQFVRVDSRSLQPGGWINIAVFVRRGLAPYVSQVRTDAVSCGIGKFVGNKGGVAVSFLYGGTRFAFVNCHLAAHTHGTKDRNRDYARLAARLLASPRGHRGCGPQANRVVPFSEPEPGEPAPSSGEGLLQGHDAVFWMGDLNYRVEGSRKAIEHAMQMGLYEVLESNDQLLREREAGRVFPGFREGPLHFKPTFKFDIDSDTYDTSKKSRVPAWTDRIMFICPKDRNGHERTGVNLRTYGCVERVRTSDHRPVAARLDVALLNRRVLPRKDFFQPTMPATCGCMG